MTQPTLFEAVMEGLDAGEKVLLVLRLYENGLLTQEEARDVLGLALTLPDGGE